MIVRLMGTGGADGIPAFYGNDRVSQYARAHRGKDIRTRAAAVIDDTLKIDLGPDTYHQMVRDGLDPRAWSALLFTHSDADHFAPDELMYVLYPFVEEDYVQFTIYANEFICDRIQAKFPDWPFELVATHSFQTFSHGEYTITPVHAFHKPEEDAHNFVIQDGRTTFLYATDTGLWEEPTWNALAQHSIDGMVIECAEAFADSNYDGHLDAHEVLYVVNRMRSEGILREGAPVLTTHMSSRGDATHQELTDFFAPYGIEVGYDGQVLEI
jgi:phosphoribosyl 1,2-cyclic phosphate phosphodiesterase